MAKVYVLGTSNSIIGIRGYVEALKMSHYVLNKSCGRNSLFYHVAHILQNREAIEACDFLLVDHYGNDANHYGGVLGESYDTYLEYFYFLLSTLNVHVVNIMFPRRRHVFKEVHEKVVKVANQYNITTVDLGQLEFRREHFIDDFHIDRFTSYMLGMFLSREIDRVSNDVPHGGVLNRFPMRVIAAKQLCSDEALQTFSNSLVSVEYFSLESSFSTSLAASERVVSLGYFRAFNEVKSQAFCVNSVMAGVVARDKGFFQEYVGEIEPGRVELVPILGQNENVPVMAKRGQTSGKFVPPCLVNLLTIDDSAKCEGGSASRDLLKFDLSGLIVSIDSCKSKAISSEEIPDGAIDKIRDTAVSMESENLNIASGLMRIAALYRPTGPFIVKKNSEYKMLKIKEKSRQ